MDSGFFDFNGDGHLNAGETAFMGMLGTKFAKQAARATKKVQREEDAAPWFRDSEADGKTNESDDDSTVIAMHGDEILDLFDADDEDYGNYDDDYNDADDVEEHEVDTSSRYAIMRAIHGGTYFEDIEGLVNEADSKGARFMPEDIIDLSYELWDEDLLVQLIAHSKPRFPQEHAYELAPRWGTVLPEYQEEAFDEGCPF